MKKNIFVTQPSLPKLDDFIESLKDIWKSKWITNNGHFHQEFEKQLTEFLGVKYVSLFSNGTLALMTALQTLKLTGEVITTPYTFVATTNALLWNGLKPVFADIDSETRMLAATVMNTCLDRVRELVLACSRIEKDADDKVSMKVVFLFMGQITAAIHKALAGDEVLALKIVEQIKEDVRLPKPGEDFTEDISDVSTPADIVLAMDKATLGEEDDVDTSLDETPPT